MITSTELVMVLALTWYKQILFFSRVITQLTLLQNVHEGPMGIGTRVQYTEVPISPGNVISDGM